MADEMGQGKIPWYTHRLMHRKRVTSELQDSYFRLMMIKPARQRRWKWHIPAWLAMRIDIEWSIELLYNSLKTGSQWVGDQSSWWQDVVEKATTRQKGPSGPPASLETRWWQDAIERTELSKKLSPQASGWAALENEKDTTLMAIRVRVNMLQFCSVSNSLSHTNLLNKVRGIFFLKKSSLVFINRVNMHSAWIRIW